MKKEPIQVTPSWGNDKWSDPDSGSATSGALDAEDCSRLFLVRGVPGSGKTTYAKTLGIADHYEADMWFEQNGGYDSSKIKLAHEWCQKKAIAAMQAGRDVVVSNTFTRLWEMQPYKDAACKLGIMVIEKVMTGEWKNVHGVPDDKVRQMRDRFEYANAKVDAKRREMYPYVEGSSGNRIWMHGSCPSSANANMEAPNA